MTSLLNTVRMAIIEETEALTAVLLILRVGGKEMEFSVGALFPCYHFCMFFYFDNNVFLCVAFSLLKKKAFIYLGGK